MSMAVEGQALRRPPVNTRRPNDITSPRVVPVSKHRDTTVESSGRKTASVPRPKEMSPEISASKMTSLSRPKETRNVIASSSGEALETSDSKRRFDGKNAAKKPEGSWAMSCICPPQSIPIATTFCTTEDGKLKGLITRSKTHYSGEADALTDVQQQRAPRAMKIPTAVLKYSNDTSMRHRTQLPISIGPDSNGKLF